MIILLEYNGVELEVAFNGTKWIEVPNDDGPKNWGSKTYMGSLSAEDVYTTERKTHWSSANGM